MSQHINYEIKARTSEKQQERIREILEINKAEFWGVNNQTDTYFKVKEGRLKLRRGDTENCLIYYERKNQKDTKEAKVKLFNNQGKIGVLERITRKSHDVLIEVIKQREIYFIGNVKVHIDKVNELGTFLEIEAQSELDEEGISKISLDKLKEQCNYHKNLFKIKDYQLIKGSYSDMLLKKRIK